MGEKRNRSDVSQRPRRQKKHIEAEKSSWPNVLEIWN
jgi:hypothetical protein